MTQADNLTSGPLPSLVPESGREIRRIAFEALEKSGQLGNPPTDLDRVARSHGVEVVSDPARLRYQYIQSLPAEKQEAAKAAFDKLKGIADLESGAVWVPDDLPPKARAFPMAHELAHHLLDWHDLPPHALHLDDSGDMQRDVRDIFEREANFAASELLFQCGLLRRRAQLRRRSAERGFTLQCPVDVSSEFEASFQATIIRYVETAGAPLALGVYYRDGEDQNSEERSGKNRHDLGHFDFWKRFASSSFAEGAWKPGFPSRIDPAHPWTQSSASDQVITGETPCPISDEPRDPSFGWESWSNGYSIFVLLRPNCVDTTTTAG